MERHDHSKPLPPAPPSGEYRADGSKRTRPSRTAKRTTNRRAAKAARKARKANR